MGTMTKLKTKLRSSSSRKDRSLPGKPGAEDADALRFSRSTSLNATVNVADDVEEVFYAHTAPSSAAGTRGTDVVYRTTEQLRGTGLEPLAEDSEASYASSSFASDLSAALHPPVLSRGPSATGGPHSADALRAELAEVKAEVAAMRREVMNEVHTLRYDVLKEVTLLKGAISQLVAAVSVPRADSPASSSTARTASSSSSAADEPAGTPPLSADVRRAIGRSPSVVTSEATKARLAAARPPSSSSASSTTASVRASSRLTQVDDDVLSAPLRPEQLDELFPLVDPQPDALKYARQLTAGTREWALRRVQDWLDSRFDVGRDTLLAVVGDGGAGKSTFAGRVAEHFAGGSLLAAHLCKFDRKAKSAPRVVLLSLVQQVVKRLPGFKRQLARLNLKYVLEEPDPCALAGKLLVDPLAAMEEPLTAYFVLIDGLDQCRATALAAGHPDIQRNELLAFLAHVLPQLPSWLGVLVTSKPMPELARALKITSVLDFSAANAEFVADASFLVDEIVDTSVVPADREAARRELARKSGGNMSFLEFTRRALAHPMAGVMDQLEGGRVDGNLTHHITLDVLQELPESLFEIYMEIFEDKFGQGRVRLWRKAQPLLTLIVAAASGPYSLVRERAARELLGLSSDDVRLLRRAFVDIVSLRDDGVFRIDSSSLFDWLCDPQRAHESFFIDPRDGLPQLKKLQALRRGGSSASSSSSGGNDDKTRAASRRTESARSASSSARFDPPSNPTPPVGILKRGSRA